MDLVEFVCDNKEALLVVISAIISFVSAWYIQKVTHSYELDSFRIELVMHACQDLYASLWDLIILTGKYVSFYSSNESIDRKRELLNEYNMGIWDKFLVVQRNLHNPLLFECSDLKQFNLKICKQISILENRAVDALNGRNTGWVSDMDEVQEVLVNTSCEISSSLAKNYSNYFYISTGGKRRAVGKS